MNIFQLIYLYGGIYLDTDFVRSEQTRPICEVISGLVVFGDHFASRFQNCFSFACQHLEIDPYFFCIELTM